MKKILPLLTLAIFIFYGSLTNATILVDSLHKKFKKIAFPHNEITATIRVETKLNYLKGNTKENDFFRALQIHEKAVKTFTQYGWNTGGQTSHKYN